MNGRANRGEAIRSRRDGRECITTATLPPKSNFFVMDFRQMAPFRPRVTVDTTPVTEKRPGVV